jgi:hypothetical protein
MSPVMISKTKVSRSNSFQNRCIHGALLAAIVQRAIEPANRCWMDFLFDFVLAFSMLRSAQRQHDQEVNDYCILFIPNDYIWITIWFQTQFGTTNLLLEPFWSLSSPPFPKRLFIDFWLTENSFFNSYKSLFHCKAFNTITVSIQQSWKIFFRLGSEPFELRDRGAFISKFCNDMACIYVGRRWFYHLYWLIATIDHYKS